MSGAVEGNRPSHPDGRAVDRTARLPAVLRALVLTLLAATFFLTAGAGRDAAPPKVIWLDSTAMAGVDLPGSDGSPATVLSSIEKVLLTRRAPGLVVRGSLPAPAPAELAMLQAAAHRAPLLVALAAAAPGLRVSPPSAPLAGRAAAIAFALRGEPGDTALVRLLGPAGPTDSLRVAIGATGAAAGAFRVRPARVGWHEWRVEAAPGVVQATGAWVRDSEPARVLVAAGPPTWESRFIMRALDEAGAQVTAGQVLGNGLALGPVMFPSSAEALAEYDAVLILPGVEPDRAQIDALERYTAEIGGGVLDAGDGAVAAALGLTEGAGAPTEVHGTALSWSLPAELTPLPAAPVRSAARTWDSLRLGSVGSARIETTGAPAGKSGLPIIDVSGADGRATVGAAPAVGAGERGGPGVLLALRPLGRGRAAALGLRETWRWRMQGGHLDEHREFWRSLVDWLAGGVRDSLFVEVGDPIGSTGAPVEIRVDGASLGAAGAAPPWITLTRPDGGSEQLALGAAPGHTGRLRATFLPETTGVYTIAVGDGPPRTAFRADRTPPPGANAWARLSLLAYRSGGAAVPSDSVGAWVARWQKAHAGSSPIARWLRPMLFVLLALAAVAEWTVRRFRGLA